MTAPNVYRKAADVIRTGGLAKAVFKDHNGAHCTVGAVRVARYGTVTQGHADDKEVIFLSELLGGPADAGAMGVAHFRMVANWSDHPDRTPEEVIGLLEQAAEKKEAEQS